MTFSRHTRLRIEALAAIVVLVHAGRAMAGDALPRDPSQLLLVGDSVTAGIYFLSIDEASIRQSWSGQLLERLGIDPPRAPYPYTYPINQLHQARRGFVGSGLAYLWDARHVLRTGGPRYNADEERAVMAVPAQTVHEVLTQSSRTKLENQHSSGWTFGSALLPEGLSLIETVEQWQKRPAWIALFIGANDLLSALGVVGQAQPPSTDAFEADYRELVTRLRNRMAPGAPSRQFFVMTLPDVTRLPFLQPLPAQNRNGDGVRFPAGSMSSAFLVPFREHFQEDEVWTPDVIAAIRTRGQDYNRAIRRIAADEGLTVIDVDALMEELQQDSTFATPASPYFSPDLLHPSFQTHARITDLVLNEMAKVAGESAPPHSNSESRLPNSADFVGKRHTRVASMMRLAFLNLESGPLSPRPTGRLGVEAAGQFGEEPIGDATVSLLAGTELTPCPLGTRLVMRFGASVRAAAVVYDDGSEEIEFFPQRSLEGRMGFGFEGIAAWTWTRFELGALLTLDGAWDGGMYTRGEWRGLYAEAAGRGWGLDRVEVGLRFGIQPGRQGRNGN